MNKNGIYLSAFDVEKEIYHRAYKASGNPEQMRRFEAAGIVTPVDISEVQAVTVLGEVMGLARPQYNMRQLCRVIPMDNLTMRIDVATGLTGQEKVAPLEEAEITKEALTPVNFDLWKNVVHVAAADEAQMKAAHPQNLLDTVEAAAELARMENKQIAEVLEANITEKVSGTVYSDWGAYTSGVSNTNPFLAIRASMDYIRGKGRVPNVFAMHSTLFSKFILNTYVGQAVNYGMATMGANGGLFTLPGYPAVRVIVDDHLTETPTGSVGPLVGSTRGAVLGVGPVYATQYRNDVADYDAYKIRQFLEPKVVIDDAWDIICT